jgi:hypothetical protein
MFVATVNVTFITFKLLLDKDNDLVSGMQVSGHHCQESSL